jgi:hypothetical protein
MSRVVESFREIESHLTRLNHASVRRLRPGIGAQDVRSRVSLPLAAEVRDLYACHDGTDDSGLLLGQVWIFPLCVFLPLETGVSTHAQFSEFDPRLPADLFPIFQSGGGGYHLTQATDRAEAPITRIELSAGEEDVVYASLSDMLETMYSAFRSGLLSVGAQGQLSMNFVAFHQLARSLNPSIEFWTRD